MTAAVFLVFFLTFLLELLFRMHGILVSIVPYAIFYYTVMLGGKKGLLISLIPAVCVTFLTGSPFPFELLTYPAVSLLALFWLYRTKSDSLPGHIVPGAIIPLLVYGPHLLGASSDAILHIVTAILPLCMISAVAFPLFILILDSLAERLGFPLYSDVKLKLRRNG